MQGNGEMLDIGAWWLWRVRHQYPCQMCRASDSCPGWCCSSELACSLERYVKKNVPILQDTQPLLQLMRALARSSRGRSARRELCLPSMGSCPRTHRHLDKTPAPIHLQVQGQQRCCALHYQVHISASILPLVFLASLSQRYTDPLPASTTCITSTLFCPRSYQFSPSVYPPNLVDLGVGGFLAPI